MDNVSVAGTVVGDQPLSAMKAFIAFEKLKEENKTKTKTINARSDEAKEAVKQYMKENSIAFIPVAEGQFLILKEKLTKPTMSTEFVAAAYHAFQRGKQRQVPLTEGQEFVRFMESKRQEQQTTDYELVLSDTKPAAAMF